MCCDVGGGLEHENSGDCSPSISEEARELLAWHMHTTGNVERRRVGSRGNARVDARTRPSLCLINSKPRIAHQ